MRAMPRRSTQSSLTLVIAGASASSRPDRPVPPWNRAVTAHPYPDLPSPWVPLWEIAARGYLVLDVTPTGVVIGVP